MSNKNEAWDFLVLADRWLLYLSVTVDFDSNQKANIHTLRFKPTFLPTPRLSEVNWHPMLNMMVKFMASYHYLPNTNSLSELANLTPVYTYIG